MSKMREFLRNYFDKHFPVVSRYYRKRRDRRLRKKIKPYRSSFGFIIQGDMSQHFKDGNADQARMQSSEIDNFLSVMNEVSVVVDIGANIGIFTMLAMNAKKRVICVEPGAQNFRNLINNLHINEFKGAEIYNNALSNHTGIQAFYGDGEMASLSENWGNTGANYSELVCINTLDNIVGNRFENEAILVKLDVEGHEYEVLEGAQFFLKRKAPIFWIVEHGLTENFSSINPHYRDLFKCFWENGYSAATFDNERMPVNKEHVENWIRERKRSFGGINFLFCNTSALQVMNSQ